MAHELAPVDHWIAGDSRKLDFDLVDENGDVIPVDDATISWGLYDVDDLRAQGMDFDATTPVISDADAGVEVVKSPTRDAANGEFRIDIDQDITDGEWGDYYQELEVDKDTIETAQQWRGPVTIQL